MLTYRCLSQLSVGSLVYIDNPNDFTFARTRGCFNKERFKYVWYKHTQVLPDFIINVFFNKHTNTTLLTIFSTTCNEFMKAWQWQT